MRLGELLIQAGVITEKALEEALSSQVMLGARVGTCLVEQGAVDLDTLSNALAQQLGVPAALATHFDRAEVAFQLYLSASFAERYECVPLFRIGKRSAVIAVVRPLSPHALDIVADELGLTSDRLVQSVAPELRIRYILERVYNISRPQRFLRAPGAPTARPKRHSFPDSGLTALELPAAVVRGRQDSGDQRRYVQTLQEGKHEDSVVFAINPDTDLEEIHDQALPAAVEAILAGDNREEIARLALTAIAAQVPAVEAVLLFTLRGAVVVSSVAFRRDGKNVPAVALAVDQPSVVASALLTKQLVRSNATLPVEARLLTTLGLAAGHLLALPLVAGGRVLGILAVASQRPVEASIIEAIGSAATSAFARLMRKAIE